MTGSAWTSGALACVGLAVLVWPGPVRASSRRLLELASTPAEPGADGRRSRARPAPGAASIRTRRLWLSLAVTGGIALFLGTGPGIVIGLVAGAVAYRLLGRVEEPAARRRRQRRQADLPGALDLAAVCLRGGVPTSRALALVADAGDGPLSEDLRSMASLQALGAHPAAVWAGHLADPVLGPVARTMTRTSDSGAAMARALRRAAADCRDEQRQNAESVARRAGVTVMAPLGLCFLPAFICLGVVPVILGIAGEVLG